MNNGIDIFEIIKARDRRFEERKKIFQSNKDIFIITISLNIPGNIKINDDYKKVFTIGYNITLNYIKSLNYKLVKKDKKNLKTGPEGYLVFQKHSENNLNTVKDKLIAIESNNEVGRLLDLDLYINENKQISRKDLSKKERSCYLCDNLAKDCVRNQKHSKKEIMSVINNIISNVI